LTFTPSFTPTLVREARFYLGRPFVPPSLDYPERTYTYGMTQFGRFPVHHGIDYNNPRGTPVQAVADGAVYYAGSDAEMLFGPQSDYYGRLVVIEHAFPTPEGEPLYTLYGHLDRVNVNTGQQVKRGDKIGAVGDQGVAIGPHLHLEVRIGNPFDFYATRNPEMWILPYPMFGMIAGRVTDTDGALLQGVIVTLKSISNPSATLRYATSYESDVVNGDAAWGENFVFGDAPQGEYEIYVSNRSGTVLFRQSITVTSGDLTWVDVVITPR
jgi:murein DD-endopeptidase MepM/ murein hydrolase activator NlpD